MTKYLYSEYTDISKLIAKLSHHRPTWKHKVLNWKIHSPLWKNIKRIWKTENKYVSYICIIFVIIILLNKKVFLEFNISGKIIGLKLLMTRYFHLLLCSKHLLKNIEKVTRRPKIKAQRFLLLNDRECQENLRTLTPISIIKWGRIWLGVIKWIEDSFKKFWK